MMSLTFALNALFAGLLATLAVVAVVRALVPRAAGRTAPLLLSAIWLAAVLVMTLRPGTGLGVRLNLVPIVVDGPGSAVDAVLNIGVFVPLGLLFALAAVRFRTLFAVALGLTLTIETVQYVTDVGRTADVNDVITNVLGACLGWLVVRGIRAAYERALGTATGQIPVASAAR